MGAEEIIDPSPLIIDEEGHHLRPAFERDDASTLELERDDASTLNDFQTSPDGDAKLRWWRHPLRSTTAYFSLLSSIFSVKFLWWLAISNFSLGGGIMTLLWLLPLPLFTALGIGAARQQLYTAVIMSPFAMKPFIGVASDLITVRGYRKRYLGLLSILLGVAGCAALLGLYHSGSVATAVAAGPAAVQRLADLIVACCFLMNLEGSALDILGEGQYSEIMRRRPASGSGVVSFRFGASLLGAAATRAYFGPLADAGRFHVLFWIALALLLAPAWPTWRGWIPERRVAGGTVSAPPCCAFERAAFRERRTPFVTIALSGLAAPLTMAASTYVDLRVGMTCALTMLVALAAATYAVFPRRFFRITVGLMLMVLSRIKITSALSNFYTANDKCLPNGPQFSYTFYMTLTGVVGSVIHLVAVVLYQALMSSWKYRPALIFSIVVGALATIVDLIIVMRWNLALGIPDKAFFLLGNATFEHLTNILHAIPMSAICAKIAPPGMESAVLAYSVGIGTFCFMVTNLLGSGIIQWTGMKTVGEECHFDSLPYLIIIFQITVPMAIGIPATLFIPNVKQTEPLIDWEAERWYKDTSNESIHSVEPAMGSEEPGAVTAAP